MLVGDCEMLKIKTLEERHERFIGNSWPKPAHKVVYQRGSLEDAFNAAVRLSAADNGIKYYIYPTANGLVV